MRLLKWMWRILKAARTLLLLALLVLSLSLNAALFVGGKVNDAAHAVFEATTGWKSVASQHADEVAELSGDLANERKTSSRLQAKVTDLSDDLASERRVAKNLRVQVREAGDKVVSFRGERVLTSEAVERTANRINQRAAKTAARSVGSTIGEVVPYFGAVVIVGVTALEIKDLCDTLKDMDELRKAFHPDQEPSFERTEVCTMPVPTREEIWASAKSSPGLAWEKSKEFLPTLDDLRSYDLPDVDWSEYWEGAGEYWERLREGLPGGETPAGASE